MAAQTRTDASSPAGGRAFSIGFYKRGRASAINSAPTGLYEIDKRRGPQLSDGSKQRVQASY